jgi:DNA-binding TFAR19-related protein (PDSD5 family)
MIEYPPNDDAKFSDSLYEVLEKISAHTRQEIREFEVRHLCDDKPLERIRKRETEYIQYDKKSKEKKGLRMMKLESNYPSPVKLRTRLQSSKFKRISRVSHVDMLPFCSLRYREYLDF